MSINLPSRQLSRSASMHLQRSTPTPSPSNIHPSLSLLTLSNSSRCRFTRHFQTSSTSSQRVKPLRPDAFVPARNETGLKSNSPTTSKATPRNTTRPVLKDEKKSSNSELLSMEVQKRAEAAAARARARFAEIQKEQPKMGSLADNSLFADRQLPQPPQRGTSTALSREGLRALDPAALEFRNPSNLAAAINPRPKARSMWQRRMVIRSVRQRGRLTRTIKIVRSERSSLSRSHFFKTSMKKLAPLARQIAGKPIDEAILQMRFSKKKVAKEVREHLIEAKNQAIVARGLGLGNLEEEPQPQLPSPTDTTALPTPNPTDSTSLEPSSTTTSPTHQATPTPKYLPGTLIPSNPTQRPPTSIYISQAWINRGPYGQSPDYRAYGRVNIMRPPSTGLSVLLKEEKTRLREARDREEKKIRRRVGKGMWTPLPDRKVTRQGQYLLW